MKRLGVSAKIIVIVGVSFLLVSSRQSWSVWS